MDGHYVPNISFGPNIVKSIRPITNKILDVHLMISPVLPYIHEFINAGADIISFHPEADENPKQIINIIESSGCRTGIAIHPRIEIDGGINKETSKICVENGADVLVAGSYIYGSPEIEYKQLINAIR